MPAALWRCTRRTVATVAEAQAQLRARRLVMKAERAARKQPAAWRDALRTACEGGADAILAQLACTHGSLSEAEQELVMSSGSQPWDAFYARHATSGYRDRHYVRSFCCHLREMAEVTDQWGVESPFWIWLWVYTVPHTGL